IRHSQHHTSRVRPIRDESRIISYHHKLTVHSPPRKRLRDLLLAFDIPVDPKITPSELQLRQVQHKRRIRQMIELTSLRIQLRQRYPLRALRAPRSSEELQVIAVRAHHRLREVCRLIAVGPVKRRLKDYLLRRIALRL